MTKPFKTTADKTIDALAGAGVEICFMNPGTSEMHLVAAIDQCANMKGVLALFEGVVTGAADGYGRVAEKPALTLLHLGPGFANGLANLHNARRAQSPILNIIGDHATYHQKFDAPLASDIAALSKTVSANTYEPQSPQEFFNMSLAALENCKTGVGQINTVIVPADCAWANETEFSPQNSVKNKPENVNIKQIKAIAEQLKSGEQTMLLLAGDALGDEGLKIAAKIAKATNCKLSSPTFVKKRVRGQGVVRAERLPYFGDMVSATLKPFKHLILVGAKAPVSFFAYAGMPSDVVPEGCQVDTLVAAGESTLESLKQLAAQLNCLDDEGIAPYRANLPPLATGKLDGLKIGLALAHFMPENTIVSDESNTNGLAVRAMTIMAKAHIWMDLTGGSIGQGMPVAIGAAFAAPKQKIVALQADGAAMYTLQSLWTMAREKLDILTIIFSNHSYAILNVEYAKLGLMANAGDEAKAMMDLSTPEIDFVKLAKGMGVDGVRVETAEAFNQALEAALCTKGPMLIDARIDPPM